MYNTAYGATGAQENIVRRDLLNEIDGDYFRTPRTSIMVARSFGCGLFLAIGNYATQEVDVAISAALGLAMFLFLLSVQAVVCYLRNRTVLARRRDDLIELHRLMLQRALEPRG